MKNAIIILLLVILLISSCEKDCDTCPIEKQITDFISYIEDRDGNIYRTVKIGDQWWMAENLRVRTYPDGSPIKRIMGDELKDQETVHKGYLIYNDSADYSELDGLFYTINAAIVTEDYQEGGQGICPSGWHLPNDDEWRDLSKFIVEDNPQDKKFDTLNVPINGVGNYLKSSYGWSEEIVEGKIYNRPNGKYLFDILPTGTVFYDMERSNDSIVFEHRGERTLLGLYYSGESSSYIRIYYYDDGFSITSYFPEIKSYALNIRCIKD